MLRTDYWENHSNFYISVHQEDVMELAEELLTFFYDCFPDQKGLGRICIAYMPKQVEEVYASPDDQVSRGVSE